MSAKLIDEQSELFFSVLRAGLWGTVPTVRLSREKFANLWVCATKQAVRGLIGQALMSTGQIPPKTAERVQNALITVAGRNMKIDHILVESVKALRSNGIEPILLKGQGIASCYTDPLLRESGDIDLYVGSKNYLKAFLTLNARGEELVETEKHAHLEIGGIIVEIHKFSDVLPPKFNKAYQSISTLGLSDGFRQLYFEGILVNTPNVTFDAFYIFNHLWRHFVAVGVGFRHLCDWAIFLHTYSSAIDRIRLESILSSLDLMRPWRVFGHVIVEYLGLPVEEMPFYDASVARTSRKVVNMMMAEGNFGHERKGRWALTGTPLFDTIRVFFVSSERYLKLLPMFGSVVFHEYRYRIMNHLVR